jgi:hypothetical protein
MYMAAAEAMPTIDNFLHDSYEGLLSINDVRQFVQDEKELPQAESASQFAHDHFGTLSHNKNYVDQKDLESAVKSPSFSTADRQNIQFIADHYVQMHHMFSPGLSLNDIENFAQQRKTIDHEVSWYVTGLGPKPAKVVDREKIVDDRIDSLSQPMERAGLDKTKVQSISHGLIEGRCELIQKNLAGLSKAQMDVLATQLRHILGTYSDYEGYAISASQLDGQPALQFQHGTTDLFVVSAARFDVEGKSISPEAAAQTLAVSFAKDRGRHEGSRLYNIP